MLSCFLWKCTIRFLLFSRPVRRRVYDLFWYGLLRLVILKKMIYSKAWIFLSEKKIVKRTHVYLGLIVVLIVTSLCFLEGYHLKWGVQNFLRKKWALIFIACLQYQLLKNPHSVSKFEILINFFEISFHIWNQIFFIIQFQSVLMSKFDHLYYSTKLRGPKTYFDRGIVFSLVKWW